MPDRFIIAQVEAGPVGSAMWAIVDTEMRGIMGQMRGEHAAQIVVDHLNEQAEQVAQEDDIDEQALSHYRDETGWPERPRAKKVVWCGCWAAEPDRLFGPPNGVPYMQDGDIFIQGPMRLYHPKG